MATYYVKTGGNDNLDGLSDANAWATITKVNSVNISGDTVKFNCRDTFNDAILSILATDSGTSSSWTTIDSYGTGDKPIFQSGIFIQLASYVNVQNIESDGNATFEPVYVSGSHDITFDNLTIDGKHQNNGVTNQAGFVSYSHSISGTPCYNLIIENSDIFDCGDATVGRSGGGIQFGGRTYNSIVRNSTVHNNTDDNILVWSNSATDINSGCSIYGNTIYNSDRTEANMTTGINLGWRSDGSMAYGNNIYDVYTALALDSGTNNISFYNNIVKDCGHFYAQFLANPSGGDSSNNKLYNNTFIATAGTTDGIHIYAQDGNTNTGHLIKNNIVYTTLENFRHIWSHVFNGSPENDFESDYNDFYSSDGNPNFTVAGSTYTTLATYQAGESQDANSIGGDPLLGFNYTLNSGSPCIGAGTPVAEVTTDYRGGGRGSTNDIGAMAYTNVVKNATLRNAILLI